MCRSSDNPVRHVISFRVTDDEKELLEDLASAWGLNVSTLMREALLSMEKTKPRLPTRKVSGRDSVLV